MSYSHTQRRKTIKVFKQMYGDDRFDSKWYPYFQQHVAEIRREIQGPPLGTLEEIMNMKREK